MFSQLQLFFSSFLTNCRQAVWFLIVIIVTLKIHLKAQVIANHRISCKKSYNEAKLLNVLYRRMVTTFSTVVPQHTVSAPYALSSGTSVRFNLFVHNCAVLLTRYHLKSFRVLKKKYLCVYWKNEIYFHVVRFTLCPFVRTVNNRWEPLLEVIVNEWVRKWC